MNYLLCILYQKIKCTTLFLLSASATIARHTQSFLAGIFRLQLCAVELNVSIFFLVVFSFVLHLEAFGCLVGVVVVIYSFFHLTLSLCVLYCVFRIFFGFVLFCCVRDAAACVLPFRGSSLTKIRIYTVFGFCIGHTIAIYLVCRCRT